jgi:hypothetical protein
MTIPDPTELVDKVSESIDDNVYSRQEAEADRTSRHLADMQSDNKLAKMIRPVMALWAMFINSILWIMSYFRVEVDDTIVLTAGGVLISIIGFYFESRRAEKINAKKASASIQIEKLRTRHEIRMERRESRRN